MSSACRVRSRRQRSASIASHLRVISISRDCDLTEGLSERPYRLAMLATSPVATGEANIPFPQASPAEAGEGDRVSGGRGALSDWTREAEGVNAMCELMEKFGERKMEEGRMESARRTAAVLLALGKLTLSQIAEATQLPMEEVERLSGATGV